MSRLELLAEGYRQIRGMSPTEFDHYVRSGRPIRLRDAESRRPLPGGLVEERLVDLSIMEIIAGAGAVGEDLPLYMRGLAPPNAQRSRSMPAAMRPEEWQSNQYQQYLIDQAMLAVNPPYIALADPARITAFTDTVDADQAFSRVVARNATLNETIEKQKTAAAEADKKAHALLRKVLPESLFAEYKEKRSFSLVGQYFKYTIVKGEQTHIRSLSCGCKKATACIQFETSTPIEDKICAEYLLLKNDERKYLETANLTWFDQDDKKAFNKEFGKTKTSVLNFAETMREYIMDFYRTVRPMSIL